MNKSLNKFLVFSHIKNNSIVQTSWNNIYPVVPHVKYKSPLITINIFTVNS